MKVKLGDIVYPECMSFRTGPWKVSGFVPKGFKFRFKVVLVSPKEGFRATLEYKPSNLRQYPS